MQLFPTSKKKFSPRNIWPYLETTEVEEHRWHMMSRSRDPVTHSTIYKIFPPTHTANDFLTQHVIWDKFEKRLISQMVENG